MYTAPEEHPQNVLATGHVRRWLLEERKAIEESKEHLRCPDCQEPCRWHYGRATGLWMLFHRDGKRCFFSGRTQHMGAGSTKPRALVMLRKLRREYEIKRP